MKNTVEFSENKNTIDKEAASYHADDAPSFMLDEPVMFEEHDEDSGDSDGLVVFEEDIEPEELHKEPVDTVEWVEEWGEDIDELADDVVEHATQYVKDLEEDLEDSGESLVMLEDGTAFVVPGTDLEVDPKSELENAVVETNWADNRDSGGFMEYLDSSYPGGIPQHDGNSMVGCERAIVYLNSLNKEISEALRNDKGGALDPMALEDYRIQLLRDMVLLKERMSHLKRDLSESTRDMSRASYKSDLQKEGATPIVQLVATPFERAVAGILINSVVSAGHPFEDVYDYLKDKYALDGRDELSIMQLVMDSGFHIFKDRGTIGVDCNDADTDPGGNIASHGIDFIKNYFA